MISMDSIALTAILDYWKEHDVEAVCLAYAELKKRDFPIDQRIQRKINAFCNKHGVANMEEFVGRMLAKKDFHRYVAKDAQGGYVLNDDLSMGMLGTYWVSPDPRLEQFSENRYPLLVTIRSIFRGLGYLSILVLIGIGFAFFIESNALPALIIAFVGCLLTCLGLFASSELIKLFMDIERNTRMGPRAGHGNIQQDKQEKSWND